MNYVLIHGCDLIFSFVFFCCCFIVTFFFFFFFGFHLTVGIIDFFSVVLVLVLVVLFRFFLIFFPFSLVYCVCYMQQCTKGKKIAGKKRLKVEDILWIVRKNKKMVARGKTLLKMNVEINQAKSMLDVGKRGKGVQ